MATSNWPAIGHELADRESHRPGPEVVIGRGGRAHRRERGAGGPHREGHARRHCRGLASGFRRRVTAPLRAVADLCCSEPAFTAGMVENLAGISKATAYRTVDALTDAGLLRQEPSIKVRGQKVWVVPAVVKALDDFAERAGRRTFGS